MGDVLYIQTDKNRKITDPHVRLGDISDLTSNNPEVLQRCKVLRVLTLESGKYGRYAVSVMKLIELIQKKEKQVEVVHVGEPQFILTYEDPAGKSERMSWLKTAFVCLVTFFGTMFSIMTFNTDVDIPKLFERISSQFTSDPRGLAILEVTYSVGIGIGVVFFFNHFGKWKITEDPTPPLQEIAGKDRRISPSAARIDSGGRPVATVNSPPRLVYSRMTARLQAGIPSLAVSSVLSMSQITRVSPRGGFMRDVPFLTVSENQ